MMMEVGSDVVEKAHYSSQKHVAIDMVSQKKHDTINIRHHRSMLPFIWYHISMLPLMFDITEACCH